MMQPLENYAILKSKECATTNLCPPVGSAAGTNSIAPHWIIFFIYFLQKISFSRASFYMGENPKFPSCMYMDLRFFRAFGANPLSFLPSFFLSLLSYLSYFPLASFLPPKNFLPGRCAPCASVRLEKKNMAWDNFRQRALEQSSQTATNERF